MLARMRLLISRNAVSRWIIIILSTKQLYFEHRIS